MHISSAYQTNDYDDEDDDDDDDNNNNNYYYYYFFLFVCVESVSPVNFLNEYLQNAECLQEFIIIHFNL